jgi:ubiquitin carboxyl-terminal hydrolase 34
MQQHVQQLLELVPVRVLSLTDEELKNEDKKTISDISRNLEGLVRAAFPNRPCQAIDDFNLDVALKCFRSPYLEKRLAGLNDIKEFIGNVRKDDPYGQKVRSTFPMMPSVLHKNDSSIDAPKLAQWLRKNNILEQLYGENMHPELVRRCVDIPRFLSSEGELEDKQLDLIWEASEGKHESICHLIYASIGELAGGLPLAQIDYLYKKICNIPFSNYSVQTVNLIRSFSYHAFQIAIHNQVCSCSIIFV